MKKKVAISIVIVVIIAMVCLLPWPTRINLMMTGAAVTEDGEVYQNVKFTIVGWKLDYLFFEDSFNVDITFKSDGYVPFRFVDTSGKLFKMPPPNFYMKYYRASNSDTETITEGCLFIRLDMGMCLMTCANNDNYCYIVGALTDLFSPEDLLKIFTPIFPPL